MKNTGITRRVDELGRIVLPIELRKQLGITEKLDSLEIYLEGNRIILEKVVDSCIFCRAGEELVSFMGKKVCKNCAAELTK